MRQTPTRPHERTRDRNIAETHEPTDSATSRPSPSETRPSSDAPDADETPRANLRPEHRRNARTDRPCDFQTPTSEPETETMPKRTNRPTLRLPKSQERRGGRNNAEKHEPNDPAKTNIRRATRRKKDC